MGLDPLGIASQGTGLPRKDGLCPLGLPFPGLVGAQRVGVGGVVGGWSLLSLPIVLEALLAWNTAQGKFPDREICRLQGPGGRPGLGLFRATAGKRGWVSASRAGGKRLAFPVVREPAL